MPQYTSTTAIGAALTSLGFRGPQRLTDHDLYWSRVHTDKVCLSNDSLQFTVSVYERYYPRWVPGADENPILGHLLSDRKVPFPHEVEISPSWDLLA